MRYLWKFCVAILVSSSLYGQIQSINVSGNWSAAVPTNTITEAGLNYTSNITSATNQTLISIVATSNRDPYTVSIRKQDTSWNANLTLWARRTGTGSGNNILTNGGLNYQQLSGSAQYFFDGIVSTGNPRSVVDIPIQYEIRGLSVLIPVSSYSTTIIYTVTSP